METLCGLPLTSKCNLFINDFWYKADWKNRCKNCQKAVGVRI